jgi:protein-S-isoprenylcysteine O-methyltransferase Ste14
MTPVVLAVIAVLAYASLALELTILHVPSVASSRNIWLSPPAVAGAYSPSWRSVFGLSRSIKLVLFIIPVLVAWGVYLYPSIALLVAGDPLGDQLFATTSTTEVAAAVLIVAGRATTLGSVLTLRRGCQSTTEGGLSTEGLFRYSRNPGLVGMYTFVWGLWLAAPSLTMLCGILVYVAHMHLKVRMEEDYLANTMGEAYRAYQRRTPRYLP